MKILVTGAGGFLGKKICEQLIEENLGEIHGIGRNYYPELESLKLKQHKLDIRDPLAVNKFFADHRFDAVIHTAAKAGIWGSFDTYYQINYRGTCHLLNASLNTGIKYFIYTSTPSVVFGKKGISNGDESLSYPQSFLTHYAHTKCLAEQEVLSIAKNKFQTISLRPHLIYGPGDPHILPRLVEKNKKGKLRIIGNGHNKVDVTHVDTAAKAHVNGLKAMIKNQSLSNEAYFIGDEKPVKLWPFINGMLVNAGQKPITKTINQKVCYGLGFFCEILYKLFAVSKEPPMTRFVCLQLSTDHYFSHQKAKAQINFS